MVGANTGNAENAHRKSLSVIRFVASMRYFSKTPSSIFFAFRVFFSLSMRNGWCCSQSGRKAKGTISHQVHIFSISLYFLSVFTRYKKANTYQLPFDHIIYVEVKRDTKTLKLFEVWCSMGEQASCNLGKRTPTPNKFEMQIRTRTQESAQFVREKHIPSCIHTWCVCVHNCIYASFNLVIESQICIHLSSLLMI